MNAETLLNAFWDEIDQRPDLPLQRFDGSERRPEACQCGTEFIVEASSNRFRTRALLLVGCAIRDALPAGGFPTDEYLRQRPFMKVLSHGPDDYDEAPRDWLIYEANGVQLCDRDWAAIADVGVTLLSDFRQWVRAHGVEEFWPGLVEYLRWLPERVQPHNPEGAYRLRAACLGVDYRRHDYSRLVGRIGEQLVRYSDHVDTFRRNGCRITHGHRPRLNFSNLSHVQDVDIVAYEPDTRAIRAIFEVKTLVDDGRRSFEANGMCAEVMRRASEQGVFIALGVVRLSAPVPYSILEHGEAERYLEQLRAHPDQYSIEYYPPGTFALVDSRFVIKSGQLGLSFG